MNKTKKVGLCLSLAIFGLGILAGIAFNLRVAYGYLDLLSFWGYPELIRYDYTYRTQDISLTGFRCPLLLTPGEVGKFSIRINNKADKQIQPVIQILVSEPERKDSYTRLKEKFLLSPGETKEFTQVLLADNSMVNYKISVRIIVANNISNPASMTRHCPVFIYQLGNLKGKQILSLISAITLMSDVIGIWLFWKFSSEEMKRTRRAISRLIGLAVLVFITMLSNMLGLYFLALIWLLLAVLLILSVIESDSIQSIFREDFIE